MQLPRVPTDSIETANPYESPRTASLRPLDEDRPWAGGVRVLRVQRGFLFRRVVFEAPLELELVYRAYNVFDTVSVDGQIADRKLGVWWFPPRFEFSLVAAGKPVPVVVEVRVGLWFFRIKSFRIEIAGQTVYSEGFWQPAPHQR